MAKSDGSKRLYMTFTIVLKGLEMQQVADLSRFEYLKLFKGIQSDEKQTRGKM